MEVKFLTTTNPVLVQVCDSHHSTHKLLYSHNIVDAGETPETGAKGQSHKYYKQNIQFQAHGRWHREGDLWLFHTTTLWREEKKFRAGGCILLKTILISWGQNTQDTRKLMHSVLETLTLEESRKTSQVN